MIKTKSGVEDFLLCSFCVRFLHVDEIETSQAIASFLKNIYIFRAVICGHDSKFKITI